MGELPLECQLLLEPSADKGLAFVEETLLPIRWLASAPRPPRFSCLLAMFEVQRGQCLDLPSPVQRDSLGSDRERVFTSIQLEFRRTRPVWTWSALWRC